MKTGIFYTSTYGTTEKIAEEIKKKLGGETDLIDLSLEKGNIDGYDNIILGSGIYAGNISKEMKSFLERYGDKIIEKNHGVYICSREEGERSKKYLAGNFNFKILQSSFCNAHLGHGMKLKKLSFIKRLLFKTAFKIKEDYTTLNKKEIDIFVKKLLDTQSENI